MHGRYGTSDMRDPMNVLVLFGALVSSIGSNIVHTEVNTHIAAVQERLANVTARVNTLNAVPPEPCIPNPCQNAGNCTKLSETTFNCTCVVGWEGDTCADNIHECESSPCQNGGTCVDLINAYNCTCPSIYTGTLCEEDAIDQCASSPCQNSGTCTDGFQSYTCACVVGFTGTNCETNIDECASSPCQNGGTCNDGVNGYTCTCTSEYTGTTCTDDAIDQCDSNPCQNGATCTDGSFEFTCTCVPGYTGTLCETDIDECASSPCQNGGTCNDLVNGFNCTCTSEFGRTLCDAQKCDTNPCENGAECFVPEGFEFACDCTSGWYGKYCNDSAVTVTSRGSFPVVFNHRGCVISGNGVYSAVIDGNENIQIYSRSGSTWSFLQTITKSTLPGVANNFGVILLYGLSFSDDGSVFVFFTISAFVADDHDTYVFNLDSMTGLYAYSTIFEAKPDPAAVGSFPSSISTYTLSGDGRRAIPRFENSFGVAGGDAAWVFDDPGGNNTWTQTQTLPDPYTSEIASFTDGKLSADGNTLVTAQLHIDGASHPDNMDLYGHVWEYSGGTYSVAQELFGDAMDLNRANIAFADNELGLVSGGVYFHRKNLTSDFVNVGNFRTPGTMQASVSQSGHIMLLSAISADQLFYQPVYTSFEEVDSVTAGGSATRSDMDNAGEHVVMCLDSSLQFYSLSTT